MNKPIINIVLYEPEIVGNTGNIIRNCVAFDSQLHLIRPYGFLLKDKFIKRSSTNHLDTHRIHEYDDWTDFMNKNKKENNHFFFYTKRAKKDPSKFNYSNLEADNIFLVFGKESTGIPKSILEENKDTLVRIPMTKDMISLNISNTVSIATYEVLKQFDFFDLDKEYENDNEEEKIF